MNRIGFHKQTQLSHWRRKAFLAKDNAPQQSEWDLSNFLGKTKRTTVSYKMELDATMSNKLALKWAGKMHPADPCSLHVLR